MNENNDKAYHLYLKGKELYENGELIEALVLFKESNKIQPHFKTLELWGEIELQLENFTEAITPLAAATALNEGVRAPSSWRVFI